MAKRSSFGNIVKKKLSDITNFQLIPRIDEISMPITSPAKDCIDKLIKENSALLKLIEERNKLIELSGVEIQKLRIVLQKLQLQNLNLAQSNSHILAEVNVGREKLKALQHEIACKDSVLKAMKLALKGKDNINLEKDREKKDELKSLPKLDNDNKPGDNNTRRAVRSQSMGACPTIQQAAEETANNKRQCLRRQSAGFKSEQGEPTGKLFEIEDTVLPNTLSACSTIQQAAEKETAKIERQCLRRQSARFKSEQGEPTEKPCEIEDTVLPNTLSACSTIQQASEKETAKTKRGCARRQSARFKSDQCEPTEKLSKVEDSKLPASSKSLDVPIPTATQALLDSSITNEQRDDKLEISELHIPPRSLVGRRSSRTDIPGAMGACSTIQQAAEQETTKNKRHCTRRQSARFKSEECEPTEKVIQIEDTNLPASKSLDISMPVETQTSADPKVKNEQKDVKPKTPELHNSRRSSVGRPSRRASAKVQSYKEVPLNIKMRRKE